jgi:type IV fimbrial biogenesis protein FimT
MRNRLPRQAGFTLMELMLVIALTAVVMAIGVPNFRNFMQNSRMTSAANDMLAAVYTARTESVKRHQPVVMCFSNDAQVAVPTCSGDGTGGWIVWVDDRNPAVAEGTDNNGIPNADEPVIVRHLAMPEAIRTRTQPNGNEGYVAFNSAGFSRQIGSVGERVDGIVMCDTRGNVSTTGSGDISAARGLLISPTGRPQVTRSINRITTDANLGGCP